MKLMVLLPDLPAPKLKSEDHSANFEDFLNSCLQKVPSSRATPNQLLRHPFIKSSQVEKGKTMESLIKEISSAPVTQDRDSANTMVRST